MCNSSDLEPHQPHPPHQPCHPHHHHHPCHPLHTPLRQRLQPQPRIRRALERHTQLKQSTQHLAEILEKQLIILGVLLDPAPKHLVLHQRHVRRQHHQALGALVLVLLRTFPGTHVPFVGLKEETVVVVCYNGGGVCPGAFEAGTVGVAAAEGVGAGEGDDFVVGETCGELGCARREEDRRQEACALTHAREDGPEVILRLRPIRQTSIRCTPAGIAVGAARTPRHNRALHFLDGGHGGKGPEVGVRDPGKLLLDRLEKVAGVGEP